MAPETIQLINLFLLGAALVLPPVVWRIKKNKTWPLDGLRLAPAVDRGLARFFDLIICLAAIWILGKLIPANPDGSGLTGVFSFMGAWLYFAGFESSPFCATPGKMMQGLVVRRCDGKRPGFILASVRFFGTVLADIPFFLGHATWFFTPYHQTFQDLITDTVVLKKQ